jgi:hypothetical protein
MNATKIARDLRISLRLIPHETFTIQPLNNEIEITWSGQHTVDFVEEYLASAGYPAYLASAGFTLKLTRN